MGNPFEGSRRQDYSEKTPITPTILNRIQDDMIEAWEARTINLMSLFGYDTSATYECGWIPDYGPTGAANRFILRTVGADNGQYMWATLPLRVGEKITKFNLMYRDNGQTGGEMALYRALFLPAGTGNADNVLNAPTKLDDIGYAAPNPWDVTPITSNFWVNIETTLGTPRIVEAGYEYYVCIRASQSAGDVCYLAGASVTAQFGTGA